MTRIPPTQGQAPVQPRETRQQVSLPVAPAASFEAVLGALQAGEASPSEVAQVARLLAAGVRLNAEALLALGMTGTSSQTGWPALPVPPVIKQAPTAPVKAVTGTPQERFAALKPHFQQSEAQTGVPWQIQAAQWALESGWGASTPKDLRTGRESFNLFGVKGNGPAGSVESLTTEVVGGKRVQEMARFRAYRSYAESILEHAQLLNSPYYAKARAAGTDLKAWTEMLGPQNLGYATDPDYSRKLWQIIAENGWDKPGA